MKLFFFLIVWIEDKLMNVFNIISELFLKDEQ